MPAIRADASAEAGGVREAVRIPRVLWILAALAVAMRAGLAVTTHFTGEDYLITLRYAENLARGHGFVYNLGERVLGTTTPLYTLFLALLTWLGLPATVLGKGVNILADSAVCLALYCWLRLLKQEKAGICAAFLAAILPLNIQWAVSGMETGLVTLCGVLVW